MKFHLFSLLLTVAPLHSAYAQFKPEECVRNGYELKYSASSDKGSYYYWEAYPGSSHSPVLIEHFDTTDDLKWTARAERGCSQGVSRCWLMLDTASDGAVEGGQMRIEMNYFALGDKSYIVFSHLWESIVYAYVKANPFNKFSLVAPDGTTDPNLEGEDFVIPNLFKEVCRG